MKTIMSLILVLFSFVFVSSVFAAGDPIQVAPTMYKLLFENDRVRQMEVTFKPGEKIGEHSHPDHFVTVLDPGKIKISKPDGTSTEVNLTAAQVMWIPAETHWAENTGTTTFRLLVTELKSSTAPATH